MASVDKTLDILNLQFTGGENETQLLIFNVDGEEFGIDVLLVQEIIRFVEPAKIPNAPRAVRGVINFRGEVIPVLDIRERFGLMEKDYDDFTVIVVVECDGKTMGLIVDKVSDIVNLQNKDCQALPEINVDEKTAYLKGMGKFGERLILLLDTGKLMDLKEKSQLNAIMEKLEEEEDHEETAG
jgi:purine-binding chemotaxis protein CheW